MQSAKINKVLYLAFDKGTSIYSVTMVSTVLLIELYKVICSISLNYGCKREASPTDEELIEDQVLCQLRTCIINVWRQKDSFMSSVGHLMTLNVLYDNDIQKKTNVQAPFLDLLIILNQP